MVAYAVRWRVQWYSFEHVRLVLVALRNLGMLGSLRIQDIVVRYLHRLAFVALYSLYRSYRPARYLAYISESQTASYNNSV